VAGIFVVEPFVGLINHEGNNEQLEIRFHQPRCGATIDKLNVIEIKRNPLKLHVRSRCNCKSRIRCGYRNRRRLVAVEFERTNA